MIRIEVGLGERSYPVVVGAGALRPLPELVPRRVGRTAVVTQAGIGVAADTGRPQRTFEIGDGEAAKTLATVEMLCRAWSSWGLTRGDAVIAVGGGVVTDVAGFAAAVYHRGVPVVHVPTTMLGMVDAAIGGKTGVNLPEGKNLVGVFWQPAAVVCDTDTLATLPERERRSGMGEMAKYHFLAEEDLMSLPLDERIAACVRLKADVVARDECEEVGRPRGRAVLNYGHTLAHALETVTRTPGQPDVSHGEAVAVGLVYAAELARRLDRIDDARVEEHYKVVRDYGLPDRLPPLQGVRPVDLVELMARDKKAVEGLTFVLDGSGGPEVVAGVDAAVAEKTLATVAGEGRRAR
jgi:5-deoxy-5-amino-3-dehydroquinate synthase